jgi:hypothetical protein
VVGFLLRSRESKAEKCRRLQEQAAELQREMDSLKSQLEQKQETIRSLRNRVEQLEADQRTRAEQPLRLPDDPPLGTHGYGARIISLCVNLAQKIGLRATETTLQIFFAWLGIPQNVPHWTTIRNWMQRVGVAAIEAPIEKADDWIWMADHSNQIGPEKALVVLAVRASKLPDPGTPLKHEDVRVLTVDPDTTWKREDMASVYEALAERFGVPRGVLVDGAVELREGAEVLKKQRSEMIVLGDFKHRAANILKSIVGQDERFTQFNTLVGRTRSAIQQTELAHLTPPSVRPKSRFMNLAATLLWAAVVLWILDHPEAKGRQSIADERLEEKLGWLREYAQDVANWGACQRVVSAGVTFINEQGLFRGAAKKFRHAIKAELTPGKSREVAIRLFKFLRESEAKLKDGERLPLSTEILESSFGLYKQLEGQHSKGGFTSLLAAFGSLLRPTTPETIRRDFAQISVKHVRQWVAKHVGQTLAAKRRMTYHEYSSTVRGATKDIAMT